MFIFHGDPTTAAKYSTLSIAKPFHWTLNYWEKKWPKLSLRHFWAPIEFRLNLLPSLCILLLCPRSESWHSFPDFLKGRSLLFLPQLGNLLFLFLCGVKSCFLTECRGNCWSSAVEGWWVTLLVFVFCHSCLRFMIRRRSSVNFSIFFSSLIQIWSSTVSRRPLFLSSLWMLDFFFLFGFYYCLGCIIILIWVLFTGCCQWLLDFR